MIDLFTYQEKKDILKKVGYEIKRGVVECCQPEYHNDMEYWEEEIDTVYKNGKPFMKPSGYGSKSEWVSNVFQHEFILRMKKHLTDVLIKTEV